MFCLGLRKWLIVALTLGVSACGGGSAPDDTGGGGSGGGGGGIGGGDPPPSALNIVTAEQAAAYYGPYLSDFSTVRSAATSGGPTAFSDPAVSGTVQYDGYMQLIMGNPVISANVIGASTLLVAFDGNAITGSADGFLGVAVDEALTRQVVSYDGTVTIQSGRIFEGTDGQTLIAFDISGSLDNGMNSFAVIGTLEGGVYGVTADGLYAIGSDTGVHGSMTTTIDGVTGADHIGIATVSALRQ